MIKATKIVIAITIVALVLYDIYVFVFFRNATLSVAITDASYYTPWVPFVFGVLMGHWFFPAKGTNDK